MRYYEFLKESDSKDAPSTSLGQSLAMNGEENVPSRYSAEDDNLERKHLDDTRKPKLTLRMINRLKMIRATKKLEMAQKGKVLGIMYGVPPAEDTTGGI